MLRSATQPDLDKDVHLRKVEAGRKEIQDEIEKISSAAYRVKWRIQQRR
ncbi:unnamed protein product, partial [Amoebophrya sp. A25]|eukprot:GSA25T00016205001.1